MEHIDVRTASGSRLIALDADRITIGKAADNIVALDDPLVSRLHAVIDRYPGGWTIRDLGSKNGTSVNGEQLHGERALRPGDEIGVGESRLIFRTDETSETPSATRGVQAAPEITRREKDILLELCRPVLEGSLLSEPATVQEIADALVVTASAVKKHLGRLYDKFGLDDNAQRRRGRLAAEAIRRGAVTLRGLRQDRH
jgi:DNA-binding transcriptional ArsR family regulator